MDQKALLIPFNSKHEIFLQDRRGHKPPAWGFFGGGIEAGETPLEAVIRESKEELDIDLTPDELISIGEYVSNYDEREVNRHMFVWFTDQEEFTVLEGAGGHWLDKATVEERLVVSGRFDAMWAEIMKLVTNS